MAFNFPNTPTVGQTFAPSGGPTYVYDGSVWKVLTPGSSFNRTTFTATSGQTTFSLTYSVNFIDVFRNGVKLNTADFTATDGATVVLANACTAGDTVEIISYPQVVYTNAVSKSGDTMTGDLTVQTNAYLATASGNVGIGTSTPAQKLDVLGNIKLNGYSIMGGAANSSANLFAGTAFNTGGASMALRGTSNGYNNGGIEFYTGAGATGNEVMRLDASGNISITQTPGKYTVDTAGGATTIANGGTVSFPNASGMLVVNSYTTGGVTIYLCGGGNTTAIASIIGQVGTLTYTSGIAGYTWTNTYGSAGVYGFFFVRTRNTA